MTQERKIKDGKDSDFSAWLRVQPEIDSAKGYVTSDIDFIWRNYKTYEWMILEEKTHGAIVPRWQGELLQMIDALGRYDRNYKGAYLVRFENTDPDNGRVMVNKRLLSREDFIKFLQFELKIEPAPLHEIKPKGAN